MTTTINNLLKTGAIAGALAGGILIFARPHKTNNITCTTLHVASGWGYEISVNNKVLIHQESIPGQNSSRGFQTEKQAMSAGRLVLSRMRSAHNPTLTSEDVSAITGK